MAEPGPYATAAASYFTAGWPSVLPLPAGRKHPPPVGYTGRGALIPSRADVQCWIEEQPGANIGVRPPEGVVGVDVDAYGGKQGKATLEELEARLGPLPRRRRTTSRDDGLSGIYWLRVPLGLGWPGVLGPGIEVIQPAHRYGVMPLSVHPETGRPYQWVTQDGEVLGWEPPRVEELEAMPAAWVAEFGKAAVPEPVGSRTQVLPADADAWLEALAPGPICGKVRRALDGALEALRGGSGRHDAMVFATFKLVRCGAEGHHGALEALVVLWEAFRAAVTERDVIVEWARMVCGAIGKSLDVVRADVDPCTISPFGPGLVMPAGPAGLMRQAEIGYSCGPETPFPAPPTAEEQFRGEVEKWAAQLRIRKAAQRLVEGEIRPETPASVRLVDLLAEPDEEVEFRIVDLWPSGGRVVLAAQRKAGKTTFVGNVVRCLVDGDRFLDHFDVKPVTGRVVLIDFEMSRAQVRRWLRDQKIKRADRITLWAMRGKAAAFDIIDPKARAEWAARLKAEGCEVLIVDCLRPILDALGLSEDKDAGIFLVALDALMAEAGIAEFILVHHAGHNGERSRGDSRLRDWPDVEWRIVRDEAQSPDQEPDPDVARYFTAEGRDVAVRESRLGYDPGTRHLTLVGGSRKETKGDAVMPELLRVLATVAPKPGMAGLSGAELEDALVRPGQSSGVVRSAIRTAIRTGAIDSVSGPRNGRYHFLSKRSAAQVRAQVDLTSQPRATSSAE
jgi:hypothetical protein